MEQVFHGLKLLSACGGGAYGEVWYCEDISGRRMALKIVSKKKIGPHWERELRGVRNYCRITGNNAALLQIYHVEEDEECFFYTMEPADSLNPECYTPDTLAARLQKGPIAPTELYRILSAVFEGIKNIHAAGFTHRDIKPDNILFVNGVPKLADIGLLSSLSATMTQLAGTLEFIPPEERTAEASESTDPLSRQHNDLYAFGKVIYCAVTGNPPSDYPMVPKDMPLTLPVKFFLRLSFQLCSKDPHRRLDSPKEVTAELADIERKLLTGETLRDRVSYFVKHHWSNLKNHVFRSGRTMRNFWYLFLIFLLIGGGTAYWIWKPEPPFDITNQKTKKYTNSEHKISMTVPFHWEIMSKDTLQSMMNEAFGDKKDKNFTPKQLEVLLEAVKQGQNAIYCDFDEKFADNIMIAVSPLTQKEMAETSEDEFRVLLKSLFEGQLEFKTEIYASKKTTIAGYPAIFLDYSYMPNVRANGYWIALPNKTIMITLTTKDKTFRQRQEEFNSVLTTLKIGK